MRNDQGFSLIELLVAVVLAASVLLATMSSTLSAMRANRTSETRTIAAAIGEDILECVRAHDTGVGAIPADCMTISNACLPSPLPGVITSATCVSPDPDVTTPATMRSVRVVVNWAGVLPGSVTLHTLLR